MIRRYLDIRRDHPNNLGLPVRAGYTGHLVRLPELALVLVEGTHDIGASTAGISPLACESLEKGLRTTCQANWSNDAVWVDAEQ